MKACPERKRITKQQPYGLLRHCGLALRHPTIATREKITIYQNQPQIFLTLEKMPKTQNQS